MDVNARPQAPRLWSPETVYMYSETVNDLAYSDGQRPSRQAAPMASV